MAIYRANSNAYESGEQYLARLQDETSKNFVILLSLLSSYWKSKIDGPIYARSLKAVSIALSQVRISLDQIYNDNQYNLTRGEFVNQVVQSLVFPDGSIDSNYSDVGFRDFLVKLVGIYFNGSVPSSIEESVKLITGTDVKIHINYEEARTQNSGFDISDQFGFSVEIALDSPSDVDMFLSDRNIRVILQIIRPAHTLYKIKYVLNDSYLGNQAVPYIGPRPPAKIVDAIHMNLSDYKYQDYRKYVLGVFGVDEGGFKKSFSVYTEDHSSSF